MKLDLLMRWVCRVAFGALILFELAGLLGFVRHEVTFTWFGLFFTSFIVFLAIEAVAWAVRRWRQRELHWPVWPVAFVAIIVDAAGDYYHWYQIFTWYDQAAHFAGSIAAAIVILAFIRAIYRVNHHHELRVDDLVMTVGLAVTVGTLYEMQEYLEDLVWGTNRLGDGFDTANDLVLNLLGVSFVVLIVAILRRRGKYPSSRGFTSR